MTTPNLALLKQHMTKLGDKPYLSEEYRLALCQADHPDVIVFPAVLRDEPDYASVEVTITIPGQPPSIRHGSCSRQEKGRDAKGRLLEMAETRGIGRALVSLGYGTQDVLDRAGVTMEQVLSGRPARTEQAARPAQAPAAAPARPVALVKAAPVAAPARISAADLDRIKTAVAALGWSKADADTYLAGYRVARFSDLTTADGAATATDLTDRAAQVQGGGPSRTWAQPAPVEAG
jgi:hypothetical protein